MSQVRPPRGCGTDVRIERHGIASPDHRQRRRNPAPPPTGRARQRSTTAGVTVIALKLARIQLGAGGTPAALTHGGLRAGLESLVSDVAPPVDLRVTGPRLSAGIETTAYFVVAEALANVVKHARAGRAVVTADVEATDLVVSICDDGSGGADPARGPG